MIAVHNGKYDCSHKIKMDGEKIFCNHKIKMDGDHKIKMEKSFCNHKIKMEKSFATIKSKWIVSFQYLIEHDESNFNLGNQ